MGCQVSAPASTRSTENGHHHNHKMLPENGPNSMAAHQQSVNDPNSANFVPGSPPLRRESFIHEMLRPQLDPSVPPIGVGGRRQSDYPTDDFGDNNSNNADFVFDETASVQICLARVISLRDGIIQSQQNLEQQQQQQNNNNNAGGGGNTNNPSPQPSITSASSDPLSTLNTDQHAPRQWICGTAVSFEWLFQRLVEKFKCPNEPEPQWIVEKLNDIGDKDLDRTTVLRITFGWENARLPKSVVLKIFESHEEDPPEEAKLGTTLFKRECQCYEWLSKQRRIAIPKIFVIKKQWSKACNALLVMEDLSDVAYTGDIGEGISQEGVRDLLRNLAQLHSLSMVQNEGWRQALSGAALPPFLYRQVQRFSRIVLSQSQCTSKLDAEKLKLLESAMESAQLERMVSQSCAQMQLPECLVHGNPIARNVFFRTATMTWAAAATAAAASVEGNKSANLNSSTATVVALIDWTQAHCGNFGEDLAKCICWNLEKRDRDEAQLLKLLQYYHYQLLRKLQSYGAPAALQKKLTLDRVTDAYERFVPLAAITFLLFLPQDLNHADGPLLDRSQCLVEEAAQMLANERAEEKNVMGVLGADESVGQGEEGK